MSTIYKTTDYSQFKFLPGNRKIAGNILIESILEKNKLATHPIVVSKDMFVIDGQHRLDAASSLGIPIYYIIDEDFEPDDITLVSEPKDLEIK